MNTLFYYLSYGLLYALSLLPFGVLYAVSDGLCFVVHRVVGYRVKVVRKNLRSSFPEKSDEELRKIEGDFYHWFCDYLVEMVKLLSVSNRTLLRHIEFRGTDVTEQCYDEGQNCAAFLGHYCNWEWLGATGLAYKRHPEAVTGMIYHPLYNRVAELLMRKVRQAKGGTPIPKKTILRAMVNYKREGRPYLFGYVADQSPKWNNIHLWLPFLHHDTPVFTGAERIVTKAKNAVFYVDMERPRRGHYIATFRLMTREPEKMEQYELTRQFFALLEQTVSRQPAFYLWTHNRWKRTHEEFDRKMVIIDGKVMFREAVEKNNNLNNTSKE